MAQVTVAVRTTKYTTGNDHAYAHDAVMAYLGTRVPQEGWPRDGWKALWERQFELNLAPRARRFPVNADCL